MKVVLLAARPAPPPLSATLPLKLAGTPAAAKELPPDGAVTEAVAGAVLSRVKLTAAPVKVLPSLSVMTARPRSRARAAYSAKVCWARPACLP